MYRDAPRSQTRTQMSRNGQDPQEERAELEVTQTSASKNRILFIIREHHNITTNTPDVLTPLSTTCRGQMPPYTPSALLE